MDGQARLGRRAPQARRLWGAALGAFSLGSVLAGLWLLGATTLGQEPPPPPPPEERRPNSLKTVRVPEPANLMSYVRDKPAAIRLGKALFWDMQVGSDGVQACASCHFHAGADFRLKNQLNPALLKGSTVFNAGGPNHTLGLIDFLAGRLDDDVVSSQGVPRVRFQDIVPGSAVENGAVEADPVFQVGGINVRRVGSRNAPSVINAVFNFRNFWDGLAQNDFNGVNPFGSRDPNARVLQVQPNGDVLAVPLTGTLALNNASLASQAVGPPLSDTQMSFAGRTFPKLGKKMLSLRPLAKQMVHPEDSRLGSMASSQVSSSMPGLETSYPDMIKAAFKNEFWDSDKVVTFDSGGRRSISFPPGRALTTDEFTVMEANFSLFFGLAVQLYEATLVSDDSPFDKFMDGNPNALTQEQQDGLVVFRTKGLCIGCHSGPEFSNATLGNLTGGLNAGPAERLERMVMGDGGQAVYDDGFYNIGVRPTAEDLGVGGTDPLGNPLSDTRMALLGRFVDPLLQPPLSPTERAAVDGAFKTAGLRNVELTGPYFHNGGKATLEQAVDFYEVGGDFGTQNIANLDPLIQPLGLDGVETQALVAFLRTLTDNRVRFERAPFDHPQLFVPDGHLGSDKGVTVGVNGVALDRLMLIPAVGAGGRALPLESFDELAAHGNRAPAAAGDAVMVAANSSNNSIDVLANDSDPDGNLVVVSSVTQAANGTVAIGGSGASVRYTPNPGFAGVDAFTYTVNDGSATASASVSVTVDRPPVAVNDSALLPRNSSNNLISVLANDSDPDGNSLFVSAVAPGANGTVSVAPGGSAVSYTFNPGFVGADTFTYSATDGYLTATATVTVTNNRPPVAAGEFFLVPRDSFNNVLDVLANDSDPDGDPITITGISQAPNGFRSFGPGGAVIVYSSRVGFAGLDTFTYTISDGIATATAGVTVEVGGSTRVFRVDRRTYLPDIRKGELR